MSFCCRRTHSAELGQAPRPDVAILAESCYPQSHLINFFTKLECYMFCIFRARPALLSLLAALVLPTLAHATTVNVVGSATNGGTPGLIDEMFGTDPVTFDLQFDIGPGPLGAASLSNVSGAFIWAAPDARSFNVDSASVQGAIGPRLFILFTGTGPGLPDLDVLDITLGFDLGVDIDGSGEELADLIGTSPLDYFFATVQSSSGFTSGRSFGATDGGAVDGVITRDELAPIPVPAGLPLMLAGLGALGVLGYRRRLWATTD